MTSAGIQFRKPRHMRTPYMTTRRSVHSIFLTLLLVLLAVPVSGQTVAPVPYLTILDDNGDPVSGCQIHVYEAGTATLATTWSDAALAVPNTNPVICDAAGRAVIYLASGASYKFTIEDAAGAVIRTVDGVQAIPSSSGNLDILGVAGESLLAGDVVYLSDGSGGLVAGKWYKADADHTYASTLPTVGMVPSPLAASATGTIRLAGKVEGLAALVVGSTYYISSTAGEMTTVAPGNQRLLGSADSVTSFVLQINTAAPTVPMSALTGTWTEVAHDGANFTQSGAGTWVVEAGDQKTFAYQARGKSVLIAFDIWTSTTTAVMGNQLRIAIPGGYTAKRIVSTPIRVTDNGTPAIGYAQVEAAGTAINCYLVAGGNWAVGANNVAVQGQIEIEIE
jgi:hypothetical protein